ncbi:hypothetical protein PAPHI01_1483 [Pancytospora philotis]|nr:hypothetical protein PAPHI01_1483 [Pancytospora philotis]
MLIALLLAAVLSSGTDFCEEPEWAAIKSCYKRISSTKLSLERRHAGKQLNEAESIKIFSGKMAFCTRNQAVGPCPEAANYKRVQSICQCTSCQLRRMLYKDLPKLPRHHYVATCLYAYRLCSPSSGDVLSTLGGLSGYVQRHRIGALSDPEKKLLKVLQLVHKSALRLGVLSAPLINLSAIAVFNLTRSGYLKTNREQYYSCYVGNKTFGLFNLGPNQFSEINRYSATKQNLITKDRPYYLNMVADNIIEYQIRYFCGAAGDASSIAEVLKRMPHLYSQDTISDFLRFYDIFLAIVRLFRHVVVLQ